jgi:ATP-dependent RNA helicase DDX23/PRP28
MTYSTHTSTATCFPLFCTGHDSEVFYDLKKLLEESKAPVPPELARSEAAKMKPGAVSQKRDSVVYAKK